MSTCPHAGVHTKEVNTSEDLVRVGKTCLNGTGGRLGDSLLPLPPPPLLLASARSLRNACAAYMPWYFLPTQTRNPFFPRWCEMRPCPCIVGEEVARTEEDGLWRRGGSGQRCYVVKDIVPRTHLA